MIDLQRLINSLPPDVNKKLSLHDLKRVTDNYNSQRGGVALERLVRTALERRAETWRQNTDDPHGINTAVYVALLEVKEAISDATANDGSPNGGDQRRHEL